MISGFQGSHAESPPLAVRFCLPFSLCNVICISVVNKEVDWRYIGWGAGARDGNVFGADDADRICDGSLKCYDFRCIVCACPKCFGLAVVGPFTIEAHEACTCRARVPEGKPISV